LRITRLTDERRKLLHLHYADAVPIDLFAQEQRRITRELENAQRQLAEVTLSFDVVQSHMERALELAEDCHAAAGIRQTLSRCGMAMRTTSSGSCTMRSPLRLNITYWGVTDAALPAAVAEGCDDVGCGPLDASPSHVTRAETRTND